MAGGREYSRHQEKIIKRYYRHRDTILVRRLSELVSDLALEPGADRLWQRAEKALRGVNCEPPLPTSQVDRVLEQRDVRGLAELAASLEARA